MRHVEGNCPHGPHTAARILNKLASYEWCVPSCMETTDLWAVQTDLSILSYCMLSAIYHWVVYYTKLGVSTTVVRQRGRHDGWVNPSGTVQLDEARDQSLSRWAKLPHYPCLEWLCIGRMKYACIVYLRKSISFAHLQINRYNGIADIDPPFLRHSQFP